MIYIILSWIYITLVAYPIGITFHFLLLKVFRLKDQEYAAPHFTLSCLSGLLVISFLTSLFCLFFPLGLLSNLILLAFAILSAYLNRRRLINAINEHIKLLKSNQIIILCLFFLYLIIIAYISYLPSSHHDDGLYYSTTIKWVQEFGTVKGLANLNPRIGFNSTWHILQANFGFHFMKMGLFNDLNGLLYLYVFMYSLSGLSALLKKKNILFNGVRALFFLPALPLHFAAKSDYIIFNINYISSSSPDLTVCILMWLIFLLFIETRVTSTDRANLNALLIVLYSAWLVTIKLSAVFIILLSIFIILQFLISKKIKLLFTILLFGFVILLPWLIRNVLVSGYLVFPFSGIDIFNVDWKIPIEHVKWHENAIRVFAINGTADLNVPFKMKLLQWLPGWFSGLLFVQQVILIFTFGATITYMIIGVVKLCKREYNFFGKYMTTIALLFSLVISSLFWLMKAPDFRLGYGYLTFYCIFSLCLLFKFFLEDNFWFVSYFAIAFMVIIMAFYYRNYLKESTRNFFSAPIHYRLPSEIQTLHLSKNQLVYLVFHDDSWNAPLPVCNNNEFAAIHPVLRRKTLKGGFKSGNPQKNDAE